MVAGGLFGSAWWRGAMTWVGMECVVSGCSAVARGRAFSSCFSTAHPRTMAAAWHCHLPTTPLTYMTLPGQLCTPATYTTYPPPCLTAHHPFPISSSFLPAALDILPTTRLTWIWLRHILFICALAPLHACTTITLDELCNSRDKARADVVRREL